MFGRCFGHVWACFWDMLGRSLGPFGNAFGYFSGHVEDMTLFFHINFTISEGLLLRSILISLVGGPSQGLMRLCSSLAVPWSGPCKAL